MAKRNSIEDINDIARFQMAKKINEGDLKAIKYWSSHKDPLF
jgi:hypothetical protein